MCLHSKRAHRIIRIASYTVIDVFRTVELHAFTNPRWWYPIKTALDVLKRTKVSAQVHKDSRFETSELFPDLSYIARKGEWLYNGFETYWRLNQRTVFSVDVDVSRIAPPRPFRLDGELYKHRNIYSGKWEDE